MRITVGHVLTVGIAGLFGTQFFIGSPFSTVKEKDVSTDNSSLSGLFHDGATSTAKTEKADTVTPGSLGTESAPNVLPESLSEASKPANELSTMDVTKSSNTDFHSEGDIAVEKKAAPTSGVPRAVGRRRPKALRKKTSLDLSKGSGEKHLSATSPSQVSVDEMVGSYVSVELTSGKKVLGILQEKTAKEVKIQLPGMGPFSYAASTVKSIQPAQ